MFPKEEIQWIEVRRAWRPIKKSGAPNSPHPGGRSAGKHADSHLSKKMNFSVPLALFMLLFIQLDTISGKECPEVFKRYSKNHSYCRPANKSCEILAYYLTNDDIKTILNLHNTYRNAIATGQKSGPQVLPTAANMLQLEWDDELASVAQNYANLCLYEHDCPGCRRVMNFGVGQNIAMQTIIRARTVPQPDWQFAVSTWFSEIIYFPSEYVCPFQPPSVPNEEFRHFSQVIWAETFRVGCGYVLYKELSDSNDVTYVRLYYCNYGPAGNTYEQCMYETGPPCSHCPENTCCGGSCYDSNEYFGLCKRINDEAPSYPEPQNTYFFCDFRRTPDCANYIEGNPNWKIMPSLSGNYLEIILNGGENSTLTFAKQILTDAETFCITFNYRKGPTLDGQVASSHALGILSVPAYKYVMTRELPDYDGPARHMFSTYRITMKWTTAPNEVGPPKQIKISFAVPPGKPAQFLNVKSVSATPGECPQQ